MGFICERGVPSTTSRCGVSVTDRPSLCDWSIRLPSADRSVVRLFVVVVEAVMVVCHARPTSETELAPVAASAASCAGVCQLW